MERFGAARVNVLSMYCVHDQFPFRNGRKVWAVAHLVDESLNLIPQLVLAVVPLDVGEGLIEARGGRVAHIGDEVG